MNRFLLGDSGRTGTKEIMSVTAVWIIVVLKANGSWFVVRDRALQLLTVGGENEYNGTFQSDAK
jgi:hypothetical protein